MDPRDGAWRYIGKSSSGMKRPKAHGRSSTLKVESHFPVHRWIEKLRRLGHEYQILVLEETTKDQLAEAECEWIAEARRQGVDLLNLTDGGEGALGYKQSMETRRKRGDALSFLVRPPRPKKARVYKRRPGAGGFRPGAPAARPIVDDQGKGYDSCGAAARELNVDRALVRRVVQGKQKSVRGRTLKYLEEI